MGWVAAAVVTAVLEIVVGCKLIRPQALVGWPEAAQPNAGSFATISIEEDHALILKSNPDGGQGSLGRMCLPLDFSQLDRVERQARAPGHFGLGQTEERPSGTQLSGCDKSLVHQNRASADLRVALK
jgi:hypothetical protein